MEKIQFSYRIPKNLLNYIKIDSIKKNTSVSENITRFIIQGMLLKEISNEDIDNILEKIDIHAIS